MEIKSFVPISEKENVWIHLEYRDTVNIKEQARVIGYGIIADKYGNFVEPFYHYKDEGIICPSQDADNLVKWELL